MFDDDEVISHANNNILNSTGTYSIQLMAEVGVS